MASVSMTVNGRRVRADIEDRTLLVYFLREQLGLTGTHVGCDTSQCGACTVLVDAAAIKSCTMFAVQANGARVTTVEGLAPDVVGATGQSPLPSPLHPIQQAFHEEHGLQCGFCTPGMLMVLHEFLRRNPDPTDDEVRHGLAGNLCRCTGYQNIVQAAKTAARLMREGASAGSATP